MATKGNNLSKTESFNLTNLSVIWLFHLEIIKPILIFSGLDKLKLLVLDKLLPFVAII